MGRARARPGGKRRLVLCYMKGRPGWSEAVDEGDEHRGSQRPGHIGKPPVVLRKGATWLA
jgi:hypothetical protein